MQTDIGLYLSGYIYRSLASQDAAITEFRNDLSGVLREAPTTEVKGGMSASFR